MAMTRCRYEGEWLIWEGLDMNITERKKLKEIRVQDVGRLISVDIEITKNYGENNE